MKKRAVTVNGLIPAAQYIRMSTEHQKFSPDNQRAANMAYAAANGYEIVATYQDSGKSGLTLKARPELKRLLSDVLSGAMPYRAILVLDVSRWGRFQDADQAAHYEYMCREAGVPVRYCSEAFDNDGGAMASIVKHMKRVMAAEYSRDLSIRIARAQRLQASMGYRQGGKPPYATRRLVVDDDRQPKMILDDGQRKALSTDKVIFVKGPALEVSHIRQIFQQYVFEKLTIAGVCQLMNKTNSIRTDRRLWSYSMVSNVLHNEIYTGVYVYGRRLSNLGQEKKAPPGDWVKSEVMEPIVPKAVFQAAAERLDRNRRSPWTEKALKMGLLRLLRTHGYISIPLIDEASYLPHHAVLTRRLGPLSQACRLIGYEKAPRATRHHVRTYTDQDLLDALVRIRKERGSLSVSTIDDDRLSPPASYFARRLGGLKNAYFRAGVKIDKSPHMRAGRHEDGKPMSKGDLLEGLRQLLNDKGYLSNSLLNKDPSVPSGYTYMARFGRLATAYALIGYAATRSEVVKLAWRRKQMLPSPPRPQDHEVLLVPHAKGGVPDCAEGCVTSTDKPEMKRIPKRDIQTAAIGTNGEIEIPVAILGYLGMPRGGIASVIKEQGGVLRIRRAQTR